MGLAFKTESENTLPFMSQIFVRVKVKLMIWVESWAAVSFILVTRIIIIVVVLFAIRIYYTFHAVQFRSHIIVSIISRPSQHYHFPPMPGYTCTIHYIYNVLPAVCVCNQSQQAPKTYIYILDWCQKWYKFYFGDSVCHAAIVCQFFFETHLENDETKMRMKNNNNQPTDVEKRKAKRRRRRRRALMLFSITMYIVHLQN